MTRKLREYTRKYLEKMYALQFIFSQSSVIWTLKLSQQSIKTPSSLTDSRNTIFESPMDIYGFALLVEESRIIEMSIMNFPVHYTLILVPNKLKLR